MRAALVVVGLTLAALVAVPTALAKSYHLTKADETFVIQRDGSVLATEALAFEFSGSFHGAYRLIPAAPGESIDQVTTDTGCASSVAACSSA
jgi:hypothetical protein